jgi:hypothetical protein
MTNSSFKSYRAKLPIPGFRQVRIPAVRQRKTVLCRRSIELLTGTIQGIGIT